MLRETNIANREKEMRESGLFEELRKAKMDVLAGESKSRPRKTGGAKRKRGGSPPPQDQDGARRSKRARRAVNYRDYDDPEDQDYKEPSSHKRLRSTKLKATASSLSQAGSSSGQASSEQSSTSQSSSGRTLRPRKVATYQEEEQPAHDDFIYCSSCKALKYHGCEEHVPHFADFKDFTLKIEVSSAGKNAGEGVVNRGSDIMEGTTFSPYTGKFWTKEQYKEQLRNHTESGNAWELKDREGLVTIGYIDPGKAEDIDPEENWLAKINCAPSSSEQNLVGFQLHGQIYYRVIKNIPSGKELLVWYGNHYARELGVNLAKMEFFQGREFHKEEDLVCGGCQGIFATGLGLDDHQTKARLKACRKAKEERLAAGGTLAVICYICKKTLPSYADLITHRTKFEECNFVTGDLHPYEVERNQDGLYPCPRIYCKKAFKLRANMAQHFADMHEKRRDYKCKTCGRSFRRKEHLKRHVNMVHRKVRIIFYKCLSIF